MVRSGVPLLGLLAVVAVAQPASESELPPLSERDMTELRVERHLKDVGEPLYQRMLALSRWGRNLEDARVMMDSVVRSDAIVDSFHFGGALYFDLWGSSKTISGEPVVTSVSFGLLGSGGSPIEETRTDWMQVALLGIIVLAVLALVIVLLLRGRGRRRRSDDIYEEPRRRK